MKKIGLILVLLSAFISLVMSVQQINLGTQKIRMTEEEFFKNSKYKNAEDYKRHKEAQMKNGKKQPKKDTITINKEDMPNMTVGAAKNINNNENEPTIKLTIDDPSILEQMNKKQKQKSEDL